MNSSRLGESSGKILLGGAKYTQSNDNPLLAGMSEKELKISLEKFMSKDSLFHVAIRQVLFKRLKYATGKLLNSISWGADTRIEKKSGNFIIHIGVYLKNPKLIDALLAGDELEDHGAQTIPSIHQLVQYINAKKKYFTDKIKNEQDRILAAQRKNLTLGKSYDERTDPVVEIAEEIRESMLKRLDVGKSPTKGSDYVFLGYKKRGSGNKQFFWAEYKKFNTAIYTINDDSGELNIVIHNMLTRYFDEFFEQQQKQMNSLLFSGNDLGEVLNRIYGISQENKAAQKLETLVNHLNDFIEGFMLSSSKNKVILQRQKKIIEARSKAEALLTRRSINEQSTRANVYVPEMNKAIREINVAFRKRKAAMRRGFIKK